MYSKIVKITEIKKCVLDASVIIKWFAKDKEVDYDKAKQILNLFQKGDLSLIVPDLLLYELGNALLKSKYFQLIDFSSALKDLYAIEIEVISISQALLCQAYKIAFNYDLTVYDATYIALAKFTNCPLITANPKCFTKIKEDFVINLVDVEID